MMTEGFKCYTAQTCTVCRAITMIVTMSNDELMMKIFSVSMH